MAKFRVTYRNMRYDPVMGEVYTETHEEVTSDYFTLPDQGGVCFMRDGLPALYIEDCFRIEMIAVGNL